MIYSNRINDIIFNEIFVPCVLITTYYWVRFHLSPRDFYLKVNISVGKTFPDKVQYYKTFLQNRKHATFLYKWCLYLVSII